MDEKIYKQKQNKCKKMKRVTNKFGEKDKKMNFKYVEA